MKKILLIALALAAAVACGDNLKPPKRPHAARNLPAVDVGPMHQISVME